MAPKTPSRSKVSPSDETPPNSSQEQDRSEEKTAEEGDGKSAHIQHAIPDMKKKPTGVEGSSSDSNTNSAPQVENKLRNATAKRIRSSEGGEGDEKDLSRQYINKSRVSARMNKGKALDSAFAATLPTGGRVFSEEDEIAILEGMIEFQLKKDHVKMMEKCGTKTEKFVFSEPHELKIFEAAAVKEEQGHLKLLTEQFDAKNSEFSFIPESASFMKEKMSLVGEAKAKKLMEKWKKLQEEEAELFLKKISLMKKQIRLVLAAMKKG